MSTPSVSVVVPTFQRRELVGKAVASVLAQTYRDFELIVVDDGSTDGTREALAGLDGRLRYEWQENAGVAAARNRGLELSRAPIVAFLDSDNRWLFDHLDLLVAVLDRHPEAVLATTCPRFTIGGDERAEDSRLHDHWPRVFTYGRHAGFISGVAIRREAVETVGGFDERFRVGEDTDLFVRLGVLGPIATVRRRTLLRGMTPTSLKERGRRSGEYLEAGELSARNVVAAAEALSPDSPLIAEAHAGLHLSRALIALDRDDLQVLRAQLERLAQLQGHSVSGVMVANRVWKHVPSAREPAGLLAAYATLAEAWPDPRADTARFVRALALILAVRTLDARQALRLAKRWPRGGSASFFLRRRNAFREFGQIVLAERRQWAQVTRFSAGAP